MSFRKSVFIKWLVFPLLCLFTIPTPGNAMRSPAQPPFISAQCPTGGNEAEQLFQLAVDYHKTRKGMPYDLDKAEKLYEEAMELGNAKAAINLGIMYRKDYFHKPKRTERLAYMIGLFEKAIEMGCPEGYNALAEAYANGWGVEESPRKAMALVKKSAELGSLNGMVIYGEYLIEEGDRREGLELMEKALKLGNGDAGHALYMEYFSRKDAPNMIRVLREGARLGSRVCLYIYIDMYWNGNDGQPKDPAYADKIAAVLDSIDKEEPPKTIPNFDELVPPREVFPYKDKR